DVVEVDRVRNDLAGAHDAREQLEALVAYGHDGHVWLDRGEGVVGGLGTCASEGVEERGLARVGHAYDPDPRAHRALKQRSTRRPSAAPSSAPPSTSEGLCTPRYTRAADSDAASRDRGPGRRPARRTERAPGEGGAAR